MAKILDLLSRAEGLRGGIPDSPDDGSARRRGLLRTGASRSASAPGTKTEDPGPRLHVGRELLTLTGQTAGTSRAAASLHDYCDTGGSRQEELDLLRQAVQMEEALGYDEPPGLPVSPRLFLAAALLRGCESGGGGSDSGEGGVATTARANNNMELARVQKEAAEEAEAVLHVLDTKYPNMGRTLLGLWRASTALGKHDDALELRERFIASWQHAEVWLVDSAHVGVGERPASAGSAQGGSGSSTGTAAEGDLDLGGGDGRDTSGSSPDSASVAAVSPEQEGEEAEEEVIATGTTATTATIVIAAALSLAVAVVVAVRRRSRARGVGCGGLNDMPCKRHLVSAGIEEETNAGQPRDPQRWAGVRKNGYSSITAV